MSVFVVKEGERGITLRFGKVLRDDDNNLSGLSAWSALEITVH
ncbi:hypothetical protein ACLB1S_02805 [Escherichia coli]